MKRPIQAGDVCEVINAMGERKSPNLGIQVRVVHFQGEHSRLGPIWHCEPMPGYTMFKLTDWGGTEPTPNGDLAQSWLQRIDPDEDLEIQKAMKKEEVDA